MCYRGVAHMNIKYTYHALSQIEEREISRNEIEHTLRNGMMTEAHDGLLKSVYKSPGKKSLAVIYSVEGMGKVKIVTAYYQKY